MLLQPTSWLHAHLVVTILLAVGDHKATVQSFPFMTAVMGHCRKDGHWHCTKKPTQPIPIDVIEVCAICGDYWSHMVGLTWCCRCDQRVFSFCWNAVYEDPSSHSRTRRRLGRPKDPGAFSASELTSPHL